MATGKGEEGKIGYHFAVSAGKLMMTRRVYSTKHGRFITDLAGVKERGKSSRPVTLEQATALLAELLESQDGGEQ